MKIVIDTDNETVVVTGCHTLGELLEVLEYSGYNDYLLSVNQGEVIGKVSQIFQPNNMS